MNRARARKPSSLAVSVLRIGSRGVVTPSSRRPARRSKDNENLCRHRVLRRGRPASQSAPRVAVGASSLNKTIPDQYCRNLYVVSRQATDCKLNDIARFSLQGRISLHPNRACSRSTHCSYSSSDRPASCTHANEIRQAPVHVAQLSNREAAFHGLSHAALPWTPVLCCRQK